MTDEELKTWAKAHSQGPMRSPLAAGILRLLHEIAAVVTAKNELVRENNALLAEKAARGRKRFRNSGGPPVRYDQNGRPVPPTPDELSAMERGGYEGGGPPAPEDESKTISFGYPPGTVFPALPPQPVVEPICGVCFESSGPPAPENESHLDGHDSLSAPSLLQLADDGCPHAGEPD